MPEYVCERYGEHLGSQAPEMQIPESPDRPCGHLEQKMTGAGRLGVPH